MKSKKRAVCFPVLLSLAVCLRPAGASPAPQAVSLPPASAGAANSTPAFGSGYPAVFSLVEDNLDATGGTLVEKKHRVVKILSPAAVQRFSDLEFPYEDPREKISIDQIKITDPDGKTRIVPGSEYKEFSPFEKYGDFGSFKVLTVQLKDLRPGSTLDYTTTRTVQPWIQGEYWSEIFLLEMDPIPIEEEDVSLTEPEGRRAPVRILHGQLPEPLVSRAPGAVTQTWKFRKLMPLMPEMSMPSPADIVPRLLISTLSGWDPILKGYRAQFFTPVQSGGFEEAYSGITQKASTPEEKAAALYAFADETIHSVPPVVGDLGKVAHPLDYSAIAKEGYGDSRDKAAVLAALLKKAGFDPQIFLVSTAGNGGVAKDFPVPFAFNRAVVKFQMGNRTVWADPFTENCPFGYLSPEDQGRTAVSLQSGEFLTTPVYPPVANLRKFEAKARISAAGDLEETLEVQASGADALGMRSVLRGMGDQERRQVIASLAAQIAGQPQVEAVSMNAVDDLNSPVVFGVKFNVKNYAVTAGDFAFLSLPINVMNYLAAVLSQTEPRKYPFVLGNTVDEVKRLEITVPAGFAVRTLPAAVKTADPSGLYQAGFAASKNKVVFSSRLVLNKAVYSPVEFTALRSLVARKSQMEASKIVFEKISSSTVFGKKRVGLRRTKPRD